MKRNDFKAFKAQVEEANEHSPIWWAGFLWINMTDKQGAEMVELLKVHPSVIRTGNNTYRTPSGFELTYNA